MILRKILIRIPTQVQRESGFLCYGYGRRDCKFCVVVAREKIGWFFIFISYRMQCIKRLTSISVLCILILAFPSTSRLIDNLLPSLVLKHPISELSSHYHPNFWYYKKPTTYPSYLFVFVALMKDLEEENVGQSSTADEVVKITYITHCLSDNSRAFFSHLDHITAYIES